jgi:carbon-monoxide dehydrogenase medium subunit
LQRYAGRFDPRVWLNMYPAQFDYHRPTSIGEACKLIGELGNDAQVLAGGCSLIPAMKFRMSQPAHLIDLARISELRGIRTAGDRLVIGATTTHWEVETSAVVREWYPGLSDAAGMIADPQVRNRGTIGGSLCYSDPAADYPANALAYGAEFKVMSRRGLRMISVDDWMKGLLETALESDEILVEVSFPRPEPRSGGFYVKIPHPASRFAVVGAAALVVADEAGRASRIRVGITGTNSMARRAAGLERSLTGVVLAPGAIETASKLASEDLEFNSDEMLSESHRRHLCGVATRDALIGACRRIGLTALDVHAGAAPSRL